MHWNAWSVSIEFRRFFELAELQEIEWLSYFKHSKFATLSAHGIKTKMLPIPNDEKYEYLNFYSIISVKFA